MQISVCGKTANILDDSHVGSASMVNLDLRFASHLLYARAEWLRERHETCWEKILGGICNPMEDAGNDESMNEGNERHGH